MAAANRISIAAFAAVSIAALAQENPTARGTSHFRVSSEARASTSFAVSEVLVAGASPFSPACGDTSGVYVGAEVEPHIAVNPANPNHLIGAWQQDRYNNGSARAQGYGISFDGGLTWTRGALPLTPCSGGPYARATDPWVAFAPDGTAHQVSLATSGTRNTPGSVSAIVMSRSADGGLTWSAPVEADRATGNSFNDKETITADPLDSRFVYAVWDRLRPAGGADTFFTRTTDAGLTWEAARIIYAPAGQTISNLIRVLPNGTLVNMFIELSGSQATIRVQRSTDRGEAWSAPITVQNAGSLGTRDPQAGTAIRDASIVPQMAVAPDGTLYVVWQDARFTQAHDGIAISRSTDGGFNWSAPVRVNADPSVPAFVPQVHVRDDGTIGVTYYDFRSNTSDAGTLPTDFWLAASRDGVNWTETRVSAPFNLATAPVANGLFVGDYTGLVASGSTFVALYAKTTGDNSNRNDVYAARITPPASIEAKQAYRLEAMPPGDPGEAFWEAVRENISRAIEGRYSKLQR